MTTLYVLYSKQQKVMVGFLYWKKEDLEKLVEKVKSKDDYLIVECAVPNNIASQLEPR